MKSFQADWRLPKNLCKFATTSYKGKVIIAGGKSRNYKTGEITIENSVYEIRFTNKRNIDMIELGKPAGVDGSYLMK